MAVDNAEALDEPQYLLEDLEHKTPRITFIQQNAPVDEYGRGVYAVARSIVRAHIDSLTTEDLSDLNTPLEDVTMRQLAKVARIERDKGLRGDGFEWAVHEAIMGQEPRVIEPVYHAMKRASPKIRDAAPKSILFGAERARYLGFIQAVLTDAGKDSYLLPEGSGRPFRFGPWVRRAAYGAIAEDFLPSRIKHIWKSDLFVSVDNDHRHLALTIKSNPLLVEAGRGLRIAIVPEGPHHNSGVVFDQSKGLWIVRLDDPNGFMGLFNDAYNAVARAICTMGKQTPPAYFTKPSAKAQKIQHQLEKFATARAKDVEDALNDAAQQDLVSTDVRLVGVNAPPWLHIKELGPKIIAPKPIFSRL